MDNKTCFFRQDKNLRHEFEAHARFCVQNFDDYERTSEAILESSQAFDKYVSRAEILLALWIT